MNTQAKIQRFILEELLSQGSRKSLDVDEPLVSTGVIDSLALLRLIGFLEQEFGLTIGDGEVMPENWETLRSITEFVERKASESGGQPAGQ